MGKFTQLNVSEDKSSVDVGLGLRWLDVYKGLDPHGIAVTGGRVPPVGVPGLVLGGGISYQNSEHGLACMCVKNFEVCSDSFILFMLRSIKYWCDTGCSSGRLDRQSEPE